MDVHVPGKTYTARGPATPLSKDHPDVIIFPHLERDSWGQAIVVNNWVELKNGVKACVLGHGSVGRRWQMHAHNRIFTILV
jgi:hypothetical protein